MNKVLIVEDETVLQEVYELVLSSNGFNVSVANNGLEGLNSVKKSTPDVVLLDIFMPVMDGKDFLKNLDKAAYPNMKIIVYTNLSDSTTRAEMMELGADDFVLKSAMIPSDLVNLVSAAADASHSK
jgi:DNA-binding response OmpR family regulator